MEDLDTPVEALGIQSHLRGVQELHDITAIQVSLIQQHVHVQYVSRSVALVFECSSQHRLQTVDAAGLPLWITELDINEVTDAESLADSYDDVITLYFSWPSVQGVLLWGFSDQHHSKPDAALFEGPDYEVRQPHTKYTIRLEPGNAVLFFSRTHPDFGGRK